MSSTYEGVIFNNSKQRYIGRAVINGTRKELCSDKDEVQCAIKRNQKLVELLGAEAAAPLLNEIDPESALGAPVDEGQPTPAPDAPADDLPFPVTEQQVDDAVAARTAPAPADDDADVRPMPFPDDLGGDLIGQLQAAGYANLRDTVNVDDRTLFKLRLMTGKKLDALRAAEAAAGLGGDPYADLAPVQEPADDDVIAPMTADERDDFDRLKAEARHSFLALARALAEISTRKLYREQFGSLEAFVAAEFDGKGRQWAYQLIDAVKTADKLAPIGVQPATERQARDLKKAAKIVDKLPPEKQQIVAQFVAGATGTESPLTVQINAVAEVVRDIDLTGTLDDPDRPGHAVDLNKVTPERRDAVILANVTQATHERLKRQQQHIADAGKQNKTLNGKGSGGSAANVNASSWSDWLMNYAAQGLSFDDEVVIKVRKDPSGNPEAVVYVAARQDDPQQKVAEGETSTRFIKAAVMSLIERLKYGGDVK